MEQLHHQSPPSQLPTTTDFSPTTAANNPLLTPNHPSYNEMITAAILWDTSQGKVGGSSKRAIAKYIDRVYSNLPPSHSALLSHHLQKMKSTGQLVMIKNSYQLPVVANANANANVNAVPISCVSTQTQYGDRTQTQYVDSTQTQYVDSTQTQYVDSTPKKRPGRPPKPKSVEPVSGATNGLTSGKRPRGRPPRDQQPVVSEVPFGKAEPKIGLDSNDNGSSQSSVKRRPGRPKKQADTQTQTFTQDPAQLQMVAVPINGAVSPKKRPGRPPKAKVGSGAGTGPISSGGGLKHRGRPKRNVLGPVSSSIGKTPRGRPPRQVGVGAVPGKRRPGRPPKGAVLPLSKFAMRSLYTGKPRGRPKKSASMPENPQKGLVDEELITKVKNMQAKIRDAIGMLKPYFPKENATNEAVIALQQLEDISIMDITVSPPPNLPSDQPVIPNDDPLLQSRFSDAAIAPTSVVPFSISDPGMTGSDQFYMPSNVGNQQPNSWISSGEALM